MKVLSKAYISDLWVLKTPLAAGQGNHQARWGSGGGGQSRRCLCNVLGGAAVEWMLVLTINGGSFRANVLRSYSCKRVQAAKFLVKTKWG